MEKVTLSILTLFALYILYSECIKLPPIIKKNKTLAYLVVGVSYLCFYNNIEGYDVDTKAPLTTLVTDIGSGIGSLPMGLRDILVFHRDHRYRKVPSIVIGIVLWVVIAVIVLWFYNIKKVVTDAWNPWATVWGHFFFVWLFVVFLLWPDHHSSSAETGFVIKVISVVLAAISFVFWFLAGQNFGGDVLSKLLDKLRNLFSI